MAGCVAKAKTMFNQIPGRENIKRELKNMVSENRIPHALLFLGPEGNGGLATAFAFVQYLLCTDKTGEDSCGNCRNCRRIQSHTHPDLHYTFPVISRKSQLGISSEFYKEWRELLAQNPYPSINQWMNILEAENKQFNINKNECHQIVRQLSLKSVEAPYKIQIIWLPEYLGKEGNRLLKIIEEPPADTLFFLVAQNTENILNTIISRCQIMNIPSFTDEEIKAFAQNQWQLSENKAQSLALLAEGNMSVAYNIVADETDELTPLFIKWMRLAFQDKDGKLVELVNEMAKLGRERQKQLLSLGLRLLRMMLLSRMAGSKPEGLEESESVFVQKMGAFIDFDGLSQLVELMDECFYAVERNANPKILFLDVSFKINGILRGVKA